MRNRTQVHTLFGALFAMGLLSGAPTSAAAAPNDQSVYCHLLTYQESARQTLVGQSTYRITFAEGSDQIDGEDVPARGGGSSEAPLSLSLSWHKEIISGEKPSVSVTINDTNDEWDQVGFEFSFDEAISVGMRKGEKLFEHEFDYSHGSGPTYFMRVLCNWSSSSLGRP
jgi:hypothetical protein